VSADSRDFFISYTQTDRGWAEWIAWQLEAANYSTFIEEWDFRAGGNFVVEMDRAAKTTRRTIAVLSPDYLAANFTQAEWAAAFARDPTGAQRVLLPVRVADCRPEGLLASTIYVDLVGVDESAAKQKLLAGVSAQRPKPMAAPATLAAPCRQRPRRPIFPACRRPCACSAKYCSPATTLPACHKPCPKARCRKSSATRRAASKNTAWRALPNGRRRATRSTNASRG
jgi:hypothetical protein